MDSGQALDFLQELANRGVGLALEGEVGLAVTAPPGVMNEDLRQRIRGAKPQLLALLRAAHAPAPPSPTSSPASSPEALGWRVAAMRAQLPPPGGALLPLMAIPARAAEWWDEASCFSCGDLLAGGVYRCRPCVQAAKLVTAEHLAAVVPNGGIE